ncbi:NUDIX hydrolase [Niveibacterium sp. SC-1]|uniref:NUDIX hydrolase n=1 Tax=Niveibacterium sp. SC-1 TaxID=3135646 RepID=UPI00311F0FD8
MASVARLEPRVCVLVMAGERVLLASPRHARHGAGLVLPETALRPGETPAAAACRALWEQVGLFHGGICYPVAAPFLMRARCPERGTLYRSWQLFVVPPPQPLPVSVVRGGVHWRFAPAEASEFAPLFARALMLVQGRLRSPTALAGARPHAAVPFSPIPFP